MLMELEPFKNACFELLTDYAAFVSLIFLDRYQTALNLSLPHSLCIFLQTLTSPACSRFNEYLVQVLQCLYYVIIIISIFLLVNMCS